MPAETPPHWRSRFDSRPLRPAISSEIVAVATVDGSVAALDANTGQTRWRVELEDRPVESPVAEDGVVAVATKGGSVFGFDGETGDRRFRFECGGGIDVAPSTNGDIVCVVDTEDNVYGIRSNDGIKEWQLPGRQSTVRRVAATDSLMGLGLADGFIEGFSQDTVKRLWKKETEGPVTTGPKLTESVLAVGTKSGAFSFYELDTKIDTRRAGTTLQFDRPVRGIGGDGSNVVVVTEDTVFRTAYSGNGIPLYGRWEVSVGELPLSRLIDSDATLSTVAVTDGIVFLGARDGTVSVLQAKSGDPLWSFEYRNDENAPQLVARDGRVFLGGTDRAIYSFQADDGIEGTYDPTLEWAVDTEAGDSQDSGLPSETAGQELNGSDQVDSAWVDSHDQSESEVSRGRKDPDSPADDGPPADQSDRIGLGESNPGERDDRINRTSSGRNGGRGREPLAPALSHLVDIYDRLESIPVQSDDPSAVSIARSVRDMLSLLQSSGVERIDPPAGTEIDPVAHEVLEMESSPEPTDHVVRVESAGFRRGEEILIPAEVVASNGSKAPTANDSFDGDPIVTTGPVYVYEGTLHREDQVRVATPAPTLCELNIEREFIDAVERWRTISSNPQTVEVVDYGETPHAWAAIAWEPYEPLTWRIDELDLRQRISIIEDIADAIRNADKYNIRHRRLSPSSVWLTSAPPGQVKAAVTDWGIIAVLERNTKQSHVSPYFAPEQITNDPVGGYTDIYQLGAMAYTLLTDVLPYKGDGQLQEAILDSTLTPPSTFDDRLNPAVDKIISKAMARNPRERYDSSYSFRVELADAL